MYKLIALDMDGTLLNSNKNISKENLTAIKNAKKLGVKIVLSTGRPLEGIKKYLNKLNLINDEDYSVVYNGAIVQNNKTGKLLCKKLLSIDDVAYLYDLSKKLNIHIHTLTPELCITPKSGKYTELECELNNIPLKVMDFHALNKELEIVKIVFADEPSLISKIMNKIPDEALSKYTVVRSAPFFLEFLNKKANKGSGVEVITESLNIDKNHVICVGDAGNDMHMIELAGLGVAMENAFPEVKKIADYITLTNDNHGVAHVINKFILSHK
ncbi:hypothetical protein BD780_003297 [Clostridium tetanomorphum]|uniref:Sugar-phosphatase n=1 Tax=Clostridium tetanomorphum TaxID=1553 RepID=A0A923EC59_CLOTT|nr:sugar-phosphatase [Clostridium tetanomorphum]KAJ51743.1 HAD superfamily hydrolase [Clostridium tetanomorphum DSM 665]MBC2399081.1 sugar-phosphatase [Clostridium tetanomorphum]MBP1865891.1 Cof subfamily protein (haloacid dehalogenase superfamily) [Clostridium tetanomorphum]NRS86072.1 hypothetical protein [Clostridium tetanomorphum]NRZ95906.1 hypothetical protein [Clostridium tetanomorphum]